MSISRVYSRKIASFLQKLEVSVKDILAKEACLRPFGNRFYDRSGRFSYPIRIVLYNNKSMLGYFDPEFYELGFHETLMGVKKTVLENILRHEIAHYLTCIEHGPHVEAHGAAFKDLCKKLGWGEEVYRASICLEEQEPLEESSLVRKVQKLMALTASTNQYEAELALMKSRELLLKHNLESTLPHDTEEERFFVKRLLQRKREDGKMRAIAKILETFFVSIVYSRGSEYTYLEVVGNGANVEIAEYVATFLDHELDTLWKSVAKTLPSKGVRAKNSFFLGLAKGYCNKVEALKRSYDPGATKSLILLENKLTEAKSLIYKHLSKKNTTHSQCLASSRAGEKAGQNLQINRALSSPTTSAHPYLLDH